MVAFALFSLLLVLGIYNFVIGKHVSSLLVYTFFLTNGFQIIPPSVLEGAPVSKFSDFALLYIIFLCFILRIKNKQFFSLNDKLSKWIVGLLLFMTIEFLLTVFLSRDEFGNAFKVYRLYIYYGLYFIIRSVKKEELLLTVKWLFRITIITTILYILQVVLKVQTLTGTVEGLTSNTQDAGYRFRNVPLLFDYFLIAVLFVPFKSKDKYFLIALFLVGFIIPLNRGPMISLVLVSCIFFLLTRKFGSLLKYSIIFLCVGLLAWPFLEQRFVKNSENVSDVTSVLTQTDFEDYNTSEGGSFAFRMALLIERANYVFNRPNLILTGIGMQHEDSPNTIKEFDFFIGAMKVNDKGVSVKQQIDSSDLVWSTILLRYGLVGVAIFLLLFIHLLKFFFNNHTIPLSMFAFLMIAMDLVNSFATDILIRPTTFFIIFLVYVLVLKSNRTTTAIKA